MKRFLWFCHLDKIGLTIDLKRLEATKKEFPTMDKHLDFVQKVFRLIKQSQLSPNPLRHQTQSKNKATTE